ncbi:MAG TPA: YihA family ribosome biogenesis GTP-binding protein [Firmicutes bacterium]|jgi:GTP-binding protein|nr:YihA family ribosome biogenesis GTP-binding protein [Bacillota bacterium]
MNFDKIELTSVAVRTTQYPTDNKPEFLIVGRSNVGKSSFINTLVNRKNLARTSAKPGKTQTLNFYNIDDLCYLVDVPGYGYAAVSNKKQEKFGLMIEEYIMNRPNLKHVFLLVDYRHKPTDNDLIMYDFLKYYNLPVTVVCTKYDKIKKSQKEKQNKLIENTIDLALGDEIIYFSKITKVGRDKIIKVMESKLD